MQYQHKYEQQALTWKEQFEVLQQYLAMLPHGANTKQPKPCLQPGHCPADPALATAGD
ncbi:hypothetical protein HaLaN_00589 [Haematococcus lacustris]|uniref:Uncharacterized protein n=1 Tax=Haematococcus lacustris TaxID=44745 RepID=A0A699YJC5_HAELA|nr:hypothetical protein HaLaN_00589 [Haematococcus lacustris]